MMRRSDRGFVISLLLLALSFGGCGGGGGSQSDGGCDGGCPQAALTPDEVRTVLAQAVGEAERLGVAATIAVLDRVGNVLAVFQMSGAATHTVITSCREGTGGLEGLVVPTAVAVISKAGTAAYLSSQGNAFTTRTASQIVQENFNPGERGRPGGPLFGVQFSQLPCGDLVTKFDSSDPDDHTGPHRMPLGFSADPGGLPLYKEVAFAGGAGMVPVGGIGVELGSPALEGCGVCSVAGDACAVSREEVLELCVEEIEQVYSADSNIRDRDVHLEERIASAGMIGFSAPQARRADRIAVDGKFLRFADDLGAGPASAGVCEDLDGAFVAVGGYTDVAACADIPGGVALGDAESGLLSVTLGGLAAEVLVDDAGDERYPPTAGTKMNELEVRTLLEQALGVAAETRAQIRRPLNTDARVSISVVDVDGEVLGIVRSPDAPVFGIDVSLQKARGAVFMSSPGARDALAATPAVAAYGEAVADFLSTRARFHGEPIPRDSVLRGTMAFADRTIGNLARPFFPDGLNGRKNGPLSRPFKNDGSGPPNAWSPFNTGFQLDLVFAGIAAATCGGEALTTCSDLAGAPNGVQIFPGSVPIYRGDELVGGVGISGDGVDQDDLIAFLGVDRASRELGGSIQNAPREMRTDNLSVDGAHLRYVGCPVRPFLGSDEQGVCDGR